MILYCSKLYTYNEPKKRKCFYLFIYLFISGSQHVLSNNMYDRKGNRYECTACRLSQYFQPLVICSSPIPNRPRRHYLLDKFTKSQRKLKSQMLKGSRICKSKISAICLLNFYLLMRISNKSIVN